MRVKYCTVLHGSSRMLIMKRWYRECLPIWWVKKSCCSAASCGNTGRTVTFWPGSSVQRSIHCTG